MTTTMSATNPITTVTTMKINDDNDHHHHQHQHQHHHHHHHHYHHHLRTLSFYHYSTVEKSACFVASYDSALSFFYVSLKSSAASGWVPGPWAGLVQGLPANLDFFQSPNRKPCPASFPRDGLDVPEGSSWAQSWLVLCASRWLMAQLKSCASQACTYDHSRHWFATIDSSSCGWLRLCVNCRRCLCASAGTSNLDPFHLMESK